MSTEEKRKKCPRCSVNLPESHFKRKRNGDLSSLCKKCLGNIKLYRDKKYRCEHGRIKNRCKMCTGDPVKITITKMLSNSKKEDKLHNRYDPVNFIDRCFLENLIDDCEDKCHYCQTELQYIEYTDDLATIERLNNKIGHIKSNCVIACFACNCSHNNKD